VKTLLATPRKGQKKSTVRDLRNERKIPAVVYGRTISNTSIHVDENEFVQMVRELGQNAIVNLMWGEASSTVKVSEVQKDPIKNEIVHIDFQEVNMNKMLSAEVPLEWVGEAQGVTKGGLLQQQLRTIEVRCLPNQIPNRIPVDVTALEIGDSLTVGDIQIPEGIEVQLSSDTVVVSVLAPTLETDPLEPQIDEDAEAEIIDPRDGPGIDVAR
jgi:large subunit ribosomal protein L25